jgi:hypothetical protein
MVTHEPISQLLWRIDVGAVAFLLLLALCTPREVYRRRFDTWKQEMGEIIGPHALFFKLIGGIVLSLFLLAWASWRLGDLFTLQKLTTFGDACNFYGFLASIVFVRIFGLKEEAHQEEQVRAALFSPRTLVKTDIGSVNNYGGNIALNNEGSCINQTVQGNALTLHQQIHSLIDGVLKSGNELTAPQKNDAVEKLKTLAEQATRPQAEREPSKIQTALKLLPGLLSSAATLAEAWEKLEPFLKRVFG